MSSERTAETVRSQMIAIIYNQLRRVWPEVDIIELADAANNAADSLLRSFAVIPKREK